MEILRNSIANNIKIEEQIAKIGKNAKLGFFPNNALLISAQKVLFEPYF